MNNGRDELAALYRAAQLEECPSHADRQAVRMAIAAAVTVGLQAAAMSASAAKLAPLAGASANGTSVGATATVGAKGAIQLLLGGKFLSGLLVGAALGTAVTATSLIVQPSDGARATLTSKSHVPGELTRNMAHAVTRNTEPSYATARQTNHVAEAENVSLVQPSVARPGESRTAMERRTAMGADAPGISSVSSEGAVPQGATLSKLVSAPSIAGASLPAAKSNRLMQETVALARVQQALSREEPNVAWSLLLEQEREFPAGLLAEERAAAKVLALCAADRTIEAEQARSAFFAAYPESPLTKRVRTSCEH